MQPAQRTETAVLHDTKLYSAVSNLASFLQRESLRFTINPCLSVVNFNPLFQADIIQI